MKAQPYFFEIKDLITQFITAFDNVVIKRYNSDRSVDSQLQVRYVYSPKQRVMYDLINQAQNITIPVISVSISSVTRDPERVFNKVPGFYFTKRTTNTDAYSGTTNYMRSPVPVNISVSMSILTKYQTDMEQIISNFVPYSNPYIVLSWQIPADFNLAVPYEIRSEVLWNNVVQLTYPTDIAANQKYRLIGDTGFVIKGWLFPAVPLSGASNIFNIDANFVASSNITIYEDLSGTSFVYPVSTGLVNDMETVVLSGNPYTGEIITGVVSGAV